MAATLIASILMQPVTALAKAAPSSAAICPVEDGDADSESAELAGSLGELMRLMTSLHVVDSAKAQRVAAYEAGEKAGGAVDAAALVSTAKEDHFRFRQAKAREEIDGAIAMLSGRRLDRETGALALDAYLTKAMIAQSSGDGGSLDEALAKAIEVDPLLDLSGRDYPPSIVARLDAVKGRREGGATGTIRIKSKPAGAEVYLNGIPRGATPVEIAGLPAGGYSLTIAANRYVDDSRDVAVSAGETLKIKSRLKWRRDAVDKGPDESADELASALSLAQALRVDRVVMVDADGNGEGSIRARVVDAVLRTGFKPLVIEGIEPERRYEQLAEMADEIASQLVRDPLADPAKSLDPIGEGDPLVLGKRKKPLTRQPLFWGAIGVAAAGALVGGILAAMSSGGSNRGTLKVSFK